MTHDCLFHLFSDLQKFFEVLSFPANLDTIMQTSAQKTRSERPWLHVSQSAKNQL